MLIIGCPRGGAENYSSVGGVRLFNGIAHRQLGLTNYSVSLLTLNWFWSNVAQIQ